MTDEEKVADFCKWCESNHDKIAKNIIILKRVWNKLTAQHKDAIHRAEEYLSGKCDCKEFHKAMVAALNNTSDFGEPNMPGQWYAQKAVLYMTCSENDKSGHKCGELVYHVCQSKAVEAYSEERQAIERLTK